MLLRSTTYGCAVQHLHRRDCEAQGVIGDKLLNKRFPDYALSIISDTHQ